VRDRRLNGLEAVLRNLAVSNHFSFEIVRDRRLNGLEAVLRNLAVSNHFSFEIVRDRRLNGPHELFYPITSITVYQSGSSQDMPTDYNTHTRTTTPH